MSALFFTLSLNSLFYIFPLNLHAQEVRPIGIIAALPQELEALSTNFKELKVISHRNDKFIRGVLNAIPVVATLSGAGKVNAALTAQRLISEYRVKALIFTGVAGGLNPSLNISDVVLGEAIFQHDFGYMGKQFVLHAIGTMPEVGIGTGKESIKYSLKDWPTFDHSEADFFATVFRTLLGIQNSLMSVMVNGELYHPKVHVGTIATGDQFIANEDKKQTLRAMGADAVEMEGAAVAQVAYRNEVPCLIIRSISDKAGVEAKLDFDKFFSTVAVNSATLVVHIFQNEKSAAYLKKL